MVTVEEFENYNCQNSAMRVEISADAKTYTSTHSGEPSETANILHVSQDYIAIQYENEERQMDDGRPHVWLMYFADKNNFTWVRQDWLDADELIQGYTPGRVRCGDL